MTRITVSSLAAAAALLAAPPASAVCELPPEHGYPARHPLTPAPLLIGDSTMHYSLPRLAHLGFEVDARSCRGFPEAVSIIRQRKAQHRLPPIVGLGVGAGWPYFTDDIERVLALIGPGRRLVLITHRKRGGAPSEDTRALRLAARRHPDRVIVVDWVRASEGKRRTWFFEDGLHVTPFGGLQYARVIAAELRMAVHALELRQRCFPDRAQPVAESPAGRVYRLAGRAVACSFGTGRQIALEGSDGPIAVAGNLVAWAAVAPDEQQQPQTVIAIASLAAGPRPRSAPLVLGPRTEVTAVTDLVAGDGGGLAWIATRIADGATRHEVARRLPGGAPEQLAVGEDVTAGSLRLGNARISWVQGGRRVGARLW